MSRKPKDGLQFDVSRWYPADAVDLMAVAELLRPYTETAFISANGGCRLLICFRDSSTADACEEAMRNHWMLCIRKMPATRKGAGSDVACP